MGQFDRERDAIERGAQELGIDPIDYATAISYETAGTFSPTQPGPRTQWGQHRGTIQYGEPQWKEHGVKPDFEDQVTRTNLDYLRKKGVKPGATFEQIYAAINGGSADRNLNTPEYMIKDGKRVPTGRTIADNIRNAQRDHRKKVLERYGWTEDQFAFNPEAVAESIWAEMGSDPDAQASEVWDQQPSTAVPGNVYLPDDQRPTAGSILPPYNPATPTNPKPIAPINIQADQPPSQTSPDGGFTSAPVRELTEIGQAAMKGEAYQPGPAAAYLKFLSETGLPDSPMALREFNKVQETLNTQNQENFGQFNQEIDAYNASLPKGGRAQQRPSNVGTNNATPPPPAPEPDVSKGEWGTVNWAQGTGKSARTFALDEAASQISNRLKIDYNVVREELENAGLSDEEAERRAAGRLQTEVGLDAQTVENVKKRSEQVGRRKQYTEATADEQVKRYLESGEIESVAQLLAAKDVGVKDIKGKPIDEVIAEERAAFERFGKQYDPADNEIVGKYAPDLAQGLITMDEARRQYRERRAADMKNDIAEALKEHGSFTKTESEAKRIDETYKYRPLAAPLEFSKGIASAIPKAASSILKTADILAEVNPLSAQNIAGYVTGKEFKADEGEVYKLAKQIDAGASYLLPPNADLKDYFQAGDTIGQIGIQIGSGILTGGVAAPLAYGSSLGASSQYEEAGKAGAGKYTKQGAAILGGLTAISDALPVAWALKPLRKGGVGQILNGFLNRAYKDAAEAVGEKEAQTFVKSLFERTVDRAITVAKGTGLEVGQEVLLDKKPNDLYASLTYDPGRKVFEITNDDLETAFFAAIGGAGGGAARIAIENKVNAEREIPGLREMLESGIETPSEVQTDETTVQKPAEPLDQTAIVPPAAPAGGVVSTKPETIDIKDESVDAVDTKVEETPKPKALSNTQVEFSKEDVKPFDDFRRTVIDDADVADRSDLPEYAKDGLYEIEPHITLKYGLHTNKADLGALSL